MIISKKTKNFLDKQGVEYSYVFVDYLEGDEKASTMKTVEKWNSSCSFPTLVINDKESIVGYKEDEIREALK